MFGVDIEDRCWLCGQATETQHHLFFACVYSRKIIQAINQCTGSCFPVTDIMDWCIQRNGTKLQRGVQIALVMGAVYQVWMQRNRSRMEKTMLRPEKVAKLIMNDIKTRLNSKDRLHMKLMDITWLERKNLM
ncbi:uncharacterized protein LOC141602032 [Silene latifolia]|uniref:uncharacterized protein LOC141602032 n=1 Tax=Silene latifolia TaxID=37657 RepID=UPI003D77E91A